MEIKDFSNGQAWAIRPETLEAMLQNLTEYQADPAVMVQLANFTPEPESRFDFALKDGVAIIPVTGPISPRGSFWSYMFGGTPLSVLQRIIMEALEDTDVEAMVLDFDSPGGLVTGTDAFSQILANAKEVKPVVAYASGDMCSSAYWFGCAADRIIAEKVAEIGSIGVAYIHMDRSKAYDEIGIKKTILSAGKYKTIGNDAQPLTDLAKKTIQDRLDYTYTIFVDTVAANRGKKPEEVLESMADGQVFIGQQALDVGLVDEIGSLDTAVQAAQQLAEDSDTTISYFYNPAKENRAMKKDIKEIVTVDDLTAALPDLAQQLLDQGAASVNTEEVTAQAETAAQENILALVDAHFGEEAGKKFKALVESGVSVEQYQAINGARPDTNDGGGAGGQDTKDKILATLQDTGADNPGADAGGGHQSVDFMALVNQYKADNKCAYAEALRAVTISNPKEHREYLKGVN